MTAEIDTNPTAVKWTKYIPHVPHVKQHAFLWLHNKEAMFGGAAGGGKGLKLNTAICTPAGWSTMGALKPGDYVFGADGRPTQVVAVSEVQFRDCYEITTDIGAKFTVDDTHKWKTMDYRERMSAHRRTPEYRERRRNSRSSRAQGNQGSHKTAAVAERNQVTALSNQDNLLGPSCGSIRTTTEIARTVLARGTRPNHSIPTCKPLLAPHADLRIDPYVLGTWLADGNSRSGGVCCYDEHVAQKLRDAGYKLSGVVGVRGGRKATTHILGLTASLRALSIHKNKHIPAQYLRASAPQRLALLQGIMDGDGHCNEKGQCELSLSHAPLAAGVRELMRSLGIKAVARPGESRLYGVRTKDRYRFKFTCDLAVFTLPYKLERQARSTDPRVHRHFITSCERVPTVGTVCIQVEAKDGMFLAGHHMIPTHNSDAILMAALQYVDVPGYAALILRRTFSDLALPGAIMSRADEWLHNTDAKWNDNKKQWKFPSGATLTFGYLQNSKDKFRYQGAEFQFCVGKGTNVLMGNHTTKAIEDIRCGELVATLEGPRPVTKTHHNLGVKSVSRVTTASDPVGILASNTHRMLTTYGWASPQELRSMSCQPVEHTSVTSTQPDSIPCTQLEYSLSGQGHSEPHHQVPAVEETDQGIAAWSKGSRNGYEEFDGSRPGISQPRRLSVPLVLYGPDPYSLRSGDLGHALSDNQIDVGKLPHPYKTTTPLQCEQDVHVSEGYIVPAGEAEVYDLTVAGASHYVVSSAHCITPSMIVSNCGFDELTQFPEEDYLYLFSRVRRPDGDPNGPTDRWETHQAKRLSKVPLRIRCATNPGGEGHRWVRARFLDKVPDAPDDDTPEAWATAEREAQARMFVPSQLEDNPSLDKGAYEASLRVLDPITRAQLRHGDWNIRQPGMWVFDADSIAAAVELGRQHDKWLEDGELGEPHGGVMSTGMDYGDFATVMLPLWALEKGGVYVPPTEVHNSREDLETIAADGIARMKGYGFWWATHYYDASFAQSNRTVMSVLTKELGMHNAITRKGRPNSVPVAFGTYKDLCVRYLRVLLGNSLAWSQGDHTVTRVLAISPMNLKLIEQMQDYEEDEFGKFLKGNDDFVDALIAGVQPMAKQHRVLGAAMKAEAQPGNARRQAPRGTGVPKLQRGQVA